MIGISAMYMQESKYVCGEKLVSFQDAKALE